MKKPKKKSQTPIDDIETLHLPLDDLYKAEKTLSYWLKKKEIQTPDDHLEALDWTLQDLYDAKVILNRWDERDDTYYKIDKINNTSVKMDRADREILKKAVQYYQEKFDNAIRYS